MVFWSTAEGPGRACCVREMSMTISIRRGKGRSLDAYSTAHWLKSINNKTTQWGARLLVHYRSITNQLYFPVCGWNVYSCAPCCAPIKDPLWSGVCIYASGVQNTDLKDMLRVFRNRSPFLFPLPPQPFIHPPLAFHHLPHLWLQCCRSESVCRRGMYVHTNTGRAAISPMPTQSACCLRSGFL